MRYLMISIILLGCMSLNAAGLLSMYSDHKSFSEGDILTVLIMETSSASSAAKSQTDKSFDHGFGTAAGKGPLDFIPLSSMDINSKNSAKGDAKTSREGSLKAKMTVRIMAIDNNGNLSIKGSKSVKINGEEELTNLEGIVRPQDVQSDNTVYSFNIADAKIGYKGKGAINDGQKIGLISRIFNFIF